MLRLKSMKLLRLHRLAVVCLWLGWLAPLRAENLVSVQDGVLVAPPEAAASTALAATDTPLVVREGAVWRYDAGTARWNNVSPRMHGSIIRGILASGSHSWLMLGQPSGRFLERLIAFAVADGASEGQPPPFPVARLDATVELMRFTVPAERLSGFGEPARIPPPLSVAALLMTAQRKMVMSVSS